MASWLRNTKERSLDGVVVPEIITLTSLEDALDGLADIFVNLFVHVWLQPFLFDAYIAFLALSLYILHLTFCRMKVPGSNVMLLAE